MKRILFVIPTLTNGGAERVASIVANFFSSFFEVKFLLLEQAGSVIYNINPLIKVTSALMNVPKRGNKISTVFNYFKNFSIQYNILCKELSDFSPEYVISFLPKADMLVYKAKKHYSFIWISSERNDPTVRNFVERNVLRHIYKKTDSLICQSNVVAQYYHKYGVKVCDVIQNPINDGIVQNVEIPYNKYAIAVGRFNVQKNYEMLIAAFLDALESVNSDTKLVILGDGPLREKCEKLVAQRNAQEQVLFLGRKVNVGDYLRKADFFIMASKYEGMPNALIEAMNAGLPVICTDFFTGTARELISEDNGYLVPVDDKKAMVSAIKSMLGKSKNSLIEMGLSGRKKLSNMDVDKVCQMWREKILSLA